MRNLFLLIIFIPSFAFPQVAQICDSISNATKEFAFDRDGGMTKQQLRDRSLRVAKEDKIDSVIVDLWFAEIDWVFKYPNRKLSPEAIKVKRFDECRDDLRKKGY